MTRLFKVDLDGQVSLKVVQGFFKKYFCLRATVQHTAVFLWWIRQRMKCRRVYNWQTLKRHFFIFTVKKRNTAAPTSSEGNKIHRLTLRRLKTFHISDLEQTPRAWHWHLYVKLFFPHWNSSPFNLHRRDTLETWIFQPKATCIRSWIGSSALWLSPYSVPPFNVQLSPNFTIRLLHNASTSGKYGHEKDFKRTVWLKPPPKLLPKLMLFPWMYKGFIWMFSLSLNFP